MNESLHYAVQNRNTTIQHRRCGRRSGGSTPPEQLRDQAEQMPDVERLRDEACRRDRQPLRRSRAHQDSWQWWRREEPRAGDEGEAVEARHHIVGDQEIKSIGQEGR